MADRRRGGGEDLGIERGIVLYGGESVATGDVLDDLWILDLTNNGTLSEPLSSLPWASDSSSDLAPLCPWHEVIAAGSAIGPDGGVEDGGLVWVAANRELVLVGGVAQTGSTLWTTGTVAVLDLDDFADGSAAMTTIGTVDYAAADVRIDAARPDVGPAYCEGDGTQVCWYLDEYGECAFEWTASFARCDNQYTAPADCGSELDEGVTYPGWCDACADDPYCVYGAVENAEGVAGSGLAGAGVVYDPVSDEIRVLGGYSGCTGGACSDWAGAYIHGQEGADSKRRAILSAWDGRIDPASGSVTARSTNMGAVYTAASGWPSGASYGLSGVAAAPLGLLYDHASRQFVRSGNAAAAYVGGTVWRDVAILQEYDLDPVTVSDECWSQAVIDEPGTWTLTRSADSLDDGLISADVAIGIVSTASPEAWSPTGLAWDPASRRDAAAAAIDADRFLVAGGRGGGGVSDILLVDRSTAAVRLLDDSTSRYGATVTYDPVSGRSYVIGGTGSTDVLVVEVDDDPARVVDTPIWQMDLSNVTLQQDGTDSDLWFVEQNFVAEHSCQDAAGGSRCGGATATLYLPTGSVAELDTLDVVVEYDDGLIARPRVTGFEVDSVTAVGLRLPRVLADGESLEVTVSYEALARDVGTIADSAGATDFGLVGFRFGDSPEAGRGWSFLALPAWWGNGVDFEADISQAVEAAWVVSPADDLAVVGTGRIEGPTGGAPFMIDGAPAMDPFAHTVMMLSGVSFALSTTTPGGVAVDVFVDDSIASDRQATIIDYAAGSTGTASLAEDLDGLVERLGAHPMGFDTIAFLRDTPGTGVGGASRHGYRWVAAVSEDGSLWNDGDDGDDEEVPWFMTAHELAHAWIGRSHEVSSTKAWLAEGLCSFAAANLHPTAWVTWADTVAAAEYFVGEIAGDGALRLEESDATFEERYLSSAYIVLQAWLLHRAGGASDAAFWSNLRDVWSGLAYGEQVDDAALESLLDGWAGFAGFHDGFVSDTELSLPMPALTTFDLPEEGDTGGSGSAGVYAIEQLQSDMLLAPEWDRAAYVLACSDAYDDEVQAFEQCGMGHPASTDPAMVPDLLVGPSAGGTLTSAAGAGTLSAVRWTMFTGPRLVSNDGAVQLRTPAADKLLRCSLGAVDPSCLVDTDGDDHPDQGDCAPSDSTTHPLWVSPDESPCAGTTTDHNCDGWTCPPL